MAYTFSQGRLYTHVRVSWAYVQSDIDGWDSELPWQSDTHVHVCVAEL